MRTNNLQWNELTVRNERKTKEQAEFLFPIHQAGTWEARLGQSLENYPEHLGLRRFSWTFVDQSLNKEMGEQGHWLGKGACKSKALGYVADDSLICNYSLFYFS